MPPSDVNSQKNDPAFKPPPQIEAGTSCDKSTTPYKLVVPFPVLQTSQDASQSTSQGSQSTSQGASQGVDPMHDVEITSPNIDARAHNDQLNHAHNKRDQLNCARDERDQFNRTRDDDDEREQLNRGHNDHRDHEGEGDGIEGERDEAKGERDGAEGDRILVTVD